MIYVSDFDIVLATPAIPTCQRKRPISYQVGERDATTSSALDTRLYGGHDRVRGCCERSSTTRCLTISMVGERAGAEAGLMMR
jgi:hypothetical protein